jgi:hypothetical protein
MTGTQLPVQIHGNPFRGEPQEDVFLCAAERWRGSANVFDVIGRRPARTVSIVEEVSRKAIRRDPFSSPGAFNPGDRAKRLPSTSTSLFRGPPRFTWLLIG